VTVPDFASPREAARAFTPGLSDLVASPLYDRVWEDPDLSKRDRSLVTVAALIAMGRREELPSSGLFATSREISVCARLRGGAGRTRTSNQTVIAETRVNQGSPH
jgi:alkylhydroperoxidase/carboxymuconolactone decarboxylase family protein YurZ